RGSRSQVGSVLPLLVRRESRRPVEGGVPQLQGDVISLEVEVPRTPNLEGLRGPHYLRGRYPHYGDPEAIPEPLRRDRASGLCVQNRDEVRDCRDDLSLDSSHEVLVLEPYRHRLAGVLVMPFYR